MNEGLPNAIHLEDLTKRYGGKTVVDRGGGIYCAASPTILNCTISGNTVDGTYSYSTGGGMYAVDSSPTLTNCTISGNTAAGLGGGGMMSRSSSPTLTNCTISGNTAAGLGRGSSFWPPRPPQPSGFTERNATVPRQDRDHR